MVHQDAFRSAPEERNSKELEAKRLENEENERIRNEHKQKADEARHSAKLLVNTTRGQLAWTLIWTQLLTALIISIVYAIATAK